MTKGKRLALVHEAAVIWGEDIDFQEFIDEGRCGADESGEVIPFDHVLRSQIVKSFQGS